MAKTAATYDFHIVIRMAEFARGMVTVPYGRSEYVYAEKNIEATLKEAVAERARLSAKERRPHVAMLGMRYSDDRAAPGLKKITRLDAPREVTQPN